MLSATPSNPPARHAIILCHPDPGSFNAAIARTYAESVGTCGQAVVVRDLYAIGFDPILKAHERPTSPDFTLSPDVAAEQALIAGCDIMVLIYPIWFGTPPAMLKGYVERVLGAGIDPNAVRQRAPHAFLAGKRLLSFTSSAASDAWLNEQGELQSLRTLFDRYLVHAFAMRGEQHVHFPRVVPGLQDRFVAENLAVVREQARKTCADLLMEYHHRPPSAKLQDTSHIG